MKISFPERLYSSVSIKKSMWTIFDLFSSTLRAHNTKHLVFSEKCKIRLLFFTNTVQIMNLIPFYTHFFSLLRLNYIPCGTRNLLYSKIGYTFGSTTNRLGIQFSQKWTYYIKITENYLVLLFASTVQLLILGTLTIPTRRHIG